ncbi:MAG: lipopolysaccharide heptosyltransferase II [Verrucomicrobia bacterium]|nr:lipopolysaccharide heptosyltransferase II [Verrucomicrobiota bacterium]
MEAQKIKDPIRPEFDRRGAGGLINPLKNPAKILVRGVNWLGDAVMSTPALSRCREAHPEAHIALLTPAKLAELWQHHPAVDSIWPIADKETAWSVGRRLRRETFDLAVVLPNSFRSALEVWLARIPIRIGYQGQWRRGLLTQAVASRSAAVPMRKRSEREIRHLIQSKTVPQAFAATNSTNSAHHIHQYLHLMSYAGASSEPVPPRLVVTEAEVKAFWERWQIAANDSRPLFGLNPGAEYGPAKRWPAERFVEAAVEIQRQTNCHWIIFGVQAESELAASIAAQIQAAVQPQSPIANRPLPTPSVHNLAGRTTLRELAAGLKACRVLLTNDSGPMHVAAALGTPVVALFGSTSPVLTGPGLPGEGRHSLLQAEVPCAPCFRRRCPIDFRCMNGISVEAVVEAVVWAQPN